MAAKDVADSTEYESISERSDSDGESASENLLANESGSESESSELESSDGEECFREADIPVEEDGEVRTERVLLPCQQQEDLEGATADRPLAGIGDSEASAYITIFKDVLGAVEADACVKASDCGSAVVEVVSSIRKHCDSDAVRTLTLSICRRLQACVESGNRYKLPSTIASRVWATYHKVRIDPEFHKLWSTHLSSLKLSVDAQAKSILALQLILDRVLQRLVTLKKEELLVKSPVALPPHASVESLSSKDKNVVNYMAGYIVHALLKRYRKKSPHPAVQKKRKIFVSVIESMKVTEEDSSCGIDSNDEWSELIDRGGLVHVKPEVFSVMERLECRIRQHLRCTTVQPSDHHAAIVSDVLSNTAMLELWQKIARKIPPRYESYSLELLREVVKLWTTTRCHSFAKCYTMQQKQAFYKHGTRKTLSTLGTSKESV